MQPVWFTEQLISAVLIFMLNSFVFRQHFATHLFVCLPPFYLSSPSCLFVGLCRHIRAHTHTPSSLQSTADLLFFLNMAFNNFNLGIFEAKKILVLAKYKEPQCSLIRLRWTQNKFYFQLSNANTGFSFAAAMPVLVQRCIPLTFHTQLHHQSVTLLFLVVSPNFRYYVNIKTFLAYKIFWKSSG